MLALMLLGACGDEGAGAAAGVAFDATRSGSSATTVQGALDELYVRCAAEPAAVAAPPPAASAASIDLTGRIQVLELRQAELAANGGYGADNVAYDPRATTLAARTVQQALDELEARVTRLEQGRVNNGAPGPALFELRDKRGNLVQDAGPPPAGAGTSKGPPPAR